MLRPEPNENHPQNLRLDAGYIGSNEVQSRGYTHHVRPRGEEKKELEHNPDFMPAVGTLNSHALFQSFSETAGPL